MGKNDYIKVRDILGNEVFRNKKTGKEYLIKWNRTGKPVWKYLKTKERKK